MKKIISHDIRNRLISTLVLFEGRHRELVAFSLIVLVGCVIYAPGLSAGFQFDDYHAIVDNSFIRHIDIPLLWSRYTIRFLTYLTFALNYSLGRFNVFGWHLVNIIIHLGATVFAYLLTRVTLESSRVRGVIRDGDHQRVALLSALIFLAHPIQTQAVTYIVQRSTSLAGLWYLATVYCYAQARIQKKVLYLYGMVVCAALAIVTKPIVVTLPVMIVLYELVFVEHKKSERVPSFVVPLAISLPIISAPFLLMKMRALSWVAAKGYNGVAQPYYLLTQFNVTLTYIRLLFFPVNQNLDYDYPIARQLFEFPTIVSLLVIVCVIVGALLLMRRYRLLSFGVLWFFLAISPQSSFYPLLEVINEHRVYIGCYGFALFASVLLYRLFRRKTVFLCSAMIAVILLAGTTYHRNILWADPLVLAKSVIKQSPKKARPYNNVGFFYFNHGDLKNARAMYEQSLLCDPGYFVARYNLGMVALQEGALAEAEDHFLRVIREQPYYAKPFVGLAFVYERRGGSIRAINTFHKAIELDEYNTTAYIGLANAYVRRGEFRAAQSVLEKALRYAPHHVLILYNLGNVHFHLGDLYEALHYYSRAAVLEPQFAEAFHNTGNVLFYLGDFEKAVVQYKKAIQQKADSGLFYYSYANALHALGRADEAHSAVLHAIALFRKAGDTQRADALAQKIHALNKKQ